MKIQDIQPIQIWNNGEQVQVEKIGVEISYDNMINFANFKYSMFSNYVNPDYQNPPVYIGYIGIEGQDYIDWGNAGDVNQEAIKYVCQKLNLTIAI